MLKEPKGWFSPLEGGICCEECRQKRLQERSAQSGGKYLPENDGVWIGTSTIYTMQFILATPLEKLFTFTVSEEVLSEFSEAMDQFLAKHVGHKMKSEELLEMF